MDVVAVLACPYRKKQQQVPKVSCFWRGGGLGLRVIGSERNSDPYIHSVCRKTTNGRHKIHDTAINIRELTNTIAPRNHFTPFGPLGPSTNPPAGCQKKELQPSKSFSKSLLKPPHCFRFSRRIGRKGGDSVQTGGNLSAPHPFPPSFLKLLLFFHIELCFVSTTRVLLSK